MKVDDWLSTIELEAWKATFNGWTFGDSVDPFIGMLFAEWLEERGDIRALFLKHKLAQEDDFWANYIFNVLFVGEWRLLRKSEKESDWFVWDDINEIVYAFRVRGADFEEITVYSDNTVISNGPKNFGPWIESIFPHMRWIARGKK